MREAAKEYSWKLNYGSIALMWRGGCIIRRLKLNLNFLIDLLKYLVSFWEISKQPLTKIKN